MRVNYERLLGPCLLVGLLAFGDAASVAAQQTGTVTGRVLAETTNRPLAGAQVVIEGLRIGVLAGADGRYTIPNVPVGSRSIRVEIIGFAAESETVNVTAGGTATLDFTLRETAVSLEEIVVTGTAAEVRAREVGNALDAITSRDIENVPVTNPENIIGGRIPGVTVVQAAGQPGAGGTVRIRGQTTASQTTEPLVYVDGVRVYNLPISLGSASRLSVSPLQDIAAADIERVEVIKGASATTLYGTEASGGVIQIFTKRGVSGDPIWNGEISMGLSRMGRVGPDSDPTEIFTRCDVAPEINYGLSQSAARLGEKDYFVDPTCPSNGTWFDDALQQRFALSVRGGSQNISYYLSSTFNDAEGTLPTQRSRDGGFRGNFDFSPFQPLRVSLNTSYTRRVSRFVEDGNNANGFLLNVGRGTNGNFKGGKGEDCADLPEIMVERPGAPAETVTPICATNGYLFDSENTATSDRYTTGLVLQYEPKQGFTHRFAIGWDYLAVESEEWEPWGYLRAPGGFYSSDGQSRSKLSLDYAGSLRNSFGESIVSTFSWGGQIFRDAARRKFVSTRDFAGPGRPTLESGGGGTGVNDSNVEQTNAGFFLQEVVGLNDRLFITGGMRVDGNSAFGDDFGLQFYPKLSAAWIVSDYGFWPEQWFDTFKLRGALGESGKAPGVFDKLRTWTPVTGDESSPGFTPGDIGNSEVGPERTREIEFGFDASLLNGRFGVEATYFSSRTRDALVPVTYPPSEGFLATRIENVGEIKGRGAEFQLSAVLLQSNAFEWRARANLGFNKTEAVDLSGQQLDADLGAGIREGDPFPSYYGVRIMNPDELAEPILVDDTLIGPVNPTRLIGLNTSFRIGQSILIDALAEHQGGHYLPNYTGYQNARRGVWYPCYDEQAKLIDQFRGNDAAVADVPAVERAKCRLNGISSKPHNSDFWYEKADFWKLRTVALTYNLPQSIVSRFASRASVTLSGSNLFLWTDYDGVDPEVEDFQDRAEGGIFDGATDYGRREYYNIPAPRTYLLSFRVTF
jgi:TonB-linked SusC/RagA family outer membrane protein